MPAMPTRGAGEEGTYLTLRARDPAPPHFKRLKGPGLLTFPGAVSGHRRRWGPRERGESDLDWI